MSSRSAYTALPDSAPIDSPTPIVGIVIAIIALLVIGILATVFFVFQRPAPAEDNENDSDRNTANTDSASDNKNNVVETPFKPFPYSGCANAECTSCLENWGPAPSEATVADPACSKVRSFGNRQTLNAYNVSDTDAARTSAYKKRAIDKGVPGSRVERASDADLACYIEFWDNDDPMRNSLASSDNPFLRKKRGKSTDRWQVGVDHNFLMLTRDDDAEATGGKQFVTCKKDGFYRVIAPLPKDPCPGVGKENFALPNCTRCKEGFGPDPADAARRGEAPCSRPYVRGTEYKLSQTCDPPNEPGKYTCTGIDQGEFYEQVPRKYGGNPFGLHSTRQGDSWTTYRQVHNSIESGDESLVESCPMGNSGWQYGAVCSRTAWIPPEDVETPEDTEFRKSRPIEGRATPPSPLETWNAAPEAERNLYTRLLCQNSPAYSRQVDKNNLRWLPIVEQKYGRTPLLSMEDVQQQWKTAPPSTSLQRDLFFNCASRADPYNRPAFRRMCNVKNSTPYGDYPLRLSDCGVNCDTLETETCISDAWPEGVRADCCT